VYCDQAIYPHELVSSNQTIKRFLCTQRTDKSINVVPVLTTSGGRRYIEFECVRYVYDERHRTFLPYNFNVGPSFADLHKQSNGLTTNDAHQRMELVGPNAIHFEGDTFAIGLVKEFSGIFYLYQMMTLWIW
jgi:cation-transporting ATPase 13A3/4/5